eukprot:scaffold228_cov312-Pinguiococcus_pyrenoidosus.AAC.71
MRLKLASDCLASARVLVLPPLRHAIAQDAAPQAVESANEQSWRQRRLGVREQGALDAGSRCGVAGLRHDTRRHVDAAVILCHSASVRLGKVLDRAQHGLDPSEVSESVLVVGVLVAKPGKDRHSVGTELGRSALVCGALQHDAQTSELAQFRLQRSGSHNGNQHHQGETQKPLHVRRFRRGSWAHRHVALGLHEALRRPGRQRQQDRHRALLELPQIGDVQSLHDGRHLPRGRRGRLRRVGGFDVEARECVPTGREASLAAGLPLEHVKVKGGGLRRRHGVWSRLADILADAFEVHKQSIAEQGRRDDAEILAARRRQGTQQTPQQSAHLNVEGICGAEVSEWTKALRSARQPDGLPEVLVIDANLSDSGVHEEQMQEAGVTEEAMRPPIFREQRQDDQHLWRRGGETLVVSLHGGSKNCGARTGNDEPGFANSCPVRGILL